MNTILSDEQALRIANSKEWFDNRAGAIDFVKPKPRKIGFKKSKVDINGLSFDELAEKYAETMERLHVYRATPKELLECLRDEIAGTVKFMVILKIRMTKIANPDQSLFLKEFEKLKEKVAISSARASEFHGLKVEINDLKQKLASGEKKRKINPDHNNEWKEKELQVYYKFKRLVRDRLGDDEYIPLIEKADEMAKSDTEAGKRLGVDSE